MASMVTALMTPLMPGAGPPPTTRASLPDLDVDICYPREPPPRRSLRRLPRGRRRPAAAAGGRGAGPGGRLRHRHRRPGRAVPARLRRLRRGAAAVAGPGAVGVGTPADAAGDAPRPGA